MLATILQAILAPGSHYSAELQPGGTQEITVSHDSAKYSFFFALEGDSSKLRFNGVLCKSAQNYSACDIQSDRCIILNNSRQQCKVSDVGTYQLFVKNTGSVEGKFYLVYDDSVLVTPPQSDTYSLSDYATTSVSLRIPVCAPDVNFTINTNGSQIYYGFNQNGATKLLSGTSIVPEYPGFLYISIKDASATFQAFQYKDERVELDGYLTETVSAWKGCNRVFLFKSPGINQPLTVAVSEVDDSVDGQMDLYYRENFTGNNYATRGDNNGFSEEQLLQTKATAQVETSAITVELPQKYGWLPHWYEVEKNLQIYTFMYYITSKNTGILPGQEISYHINNSSYVIAIPFKSSRQAIQTTNDPIRSNYVIRMVNTENKGDGNATLQFGHTTPHDNAFKVYTVGKNVYESSANYTENNTYQSDLFFATVICADVQCSGQFRAQHSYKLQPRVPMTLGHTPWEGTSAAYYLHYDLRNKGLDMRIAHSGNVSVYISQYDMMPSSTSNGTLKFPCSSSEPICTIQIDEEKFVPDMDLHIAILSTNTITVTAANIGENVFQLEEAVPQIQYLNFQNATAPESLQFIFNPNYVTHFTDDHTKEAVLLNFEAMKLKAEELPADMQISFYISAKPNPDPLNYIVKRTLREGQLEESVYAQNITKVQITVPTPYGGNLYAAIYCEGLGCQAFSSSPLGASRLQFRITAYTTEEMAEQSPDVLQQNFFYARQTTIMEYFQLVAEETSKLSITFASDNECRGIQYRIYACMGAIASPWIIDGNVTQGHCFFYSGDYKRAVQIQLDTSSDKIAAGNVYVTILPDFSDFTGDINVIDNCKNIYALYKAEQISDFQQAQYGEIYAPGILNGAHFMAKVPTITMSAASKTNALGDRLVIQLQSTKKLRICASDILDIYYPSPLQQQCLGGTPLPLDYDSQYYIYYEHYMNRPGAGYILSHTNVYFTIWTEDEFVQGEKCSFNLTIAPQAVLDPRGAGFPMKFVASQYSGLSRFVSYAFDLSKLSQAERSRMAFVVGPYCNDSFCRQQELPDEFYGETLITAVSGSRLLPVSSDASAVFYNKGPSLFQLENVIGSQDQTVYVTLEYRNYYKLNSANKESQMAFQADVLENYNVQEQAIDYQTVKKREGGENVTGAVIDYYNTELSYIPSEIIVYPCRGKPALLLDGISPLSNPAYGDYQTMVTNEWGKPLYYQFYDQKISRMQEFITIYDQQKFDFATGKFMANESKMEYQISVGSQVEATRPGNRGQLTVVSYSPSGKGKVTVRFYPAAIPNQMDDVSSINYYMYAIPYSGSFDQENDYSPYTACGARKIGHSIYVNSAGGPHMAVDDEFVKKHGYAEVTSNLDLWDQAPPGAILYVTILTDTTSYIGILAGQKEVSAELLITITFVVVILIILALLLVFWMLFIRLRKQKISGYKPVTE